MAHRHLIPTVAVRRIDDGVYITDNGRWRVVSWRGRWLVTDGWGLWNRGRSVVARTLYDGRATIGSATHTQEGRPQPRPPRRRPAGAAR